MPRPDTLGLQLSPAIKDVASAEIVAQYRCQDRKVSKWHIPGIGPIADICVARTPKHAAIVRNVNSNAIGQMSLTLTRLFGCAAAKMGKDQSFDGRAPNEPTARGFHPSRPLSLLGRSFKL